MKVIVHAPAPRCKDKRRKFLLQIGGGEGFKVDIRCFDAVAVDHLDSSRRLTIVGEHFSRTMKVAVSSI